MAVRFHLADHVHTDIVAHSTNGFPVRTGEQFLEFPRAAAAAASAITSRRCSTARTPPALPYPTKPDVLASPMSG